MHYGFEQASEFGEMATPPERPNLGLLGLVLFCPSWQIRQVEFARHATSMTDRAKVLHQEEDHLITGASSGFGLMLANTLHRQGHTVIGTSRNHERYAGRFPFKLLRLDIGYDD